MWWQKVDWAAGQAGEQAGVQKTLWNNGVRGQRFLAVFKLRFGKEVDVVVGAIGGSVRAGGLLGVLIGVIHAINYLAALLLRSDRKDSLPRKAARLRRAAPRGCRNRVQCKPELL